MAELVGRPGVETDRVALVIGRGGGENLEDVPAGPRLAAASRHRVRVLFLDAPDDVLVRRFEGTRRRHPLGRAGGGGVDRRRAPLPGAGAGRGRHRDRHRRAERQPAPAADPRAVRRRAAHGACRPRCVSFGYKHGVPLDVDLRLRLPVPAQPLLGGGAAPPERPRRRRCASTCSPSPRRPSFLDQGGGPVGHRSCRPSCGRASRT